MVDAGARERMGDELFQRFATGAPAASWAALENGPGTSVTAAAALAIALKPSVIGRKTWIKAPTTSTNSPAATAFLLVTAGIVFVM